MGEIEKRTNDIDHDILIDSAFTIREIESNRVNVVDTPVSINIRLGFGIGGYTLANLVSNGNSRKSSDSHPTKLTENQKEFIRRSEESNCKGFDPLIFFPEQYETDSDAKRICAGCSIAELCLEYAIDGNERHGIWGGKNPSERRKIVKLRAND